MHFQLMKSVTFKLMTILKDRLYVWMNLQYLLVISRNQCSNAEIQLFYLIV